MQPDLMERRRVYLPATRAVLAWTATNPGPIVWVFYRDEGGPGEHLSLELTVRGRRRLTMRFPRPASEQDGVYRACFVAADLDRLRDRLAMGFGAPEG